MALVSHQYSLSIFIVIASLSLLLNPISCFNPKLLNVSLKYQSDSAWGSAGATWYGSPNGAGSDGNSIIYPNQKYLNDNIYEHLNVTFIYVCIYNVNLNKFWYVYL